MKLLLTNPVTAEYDIEDWHVREYASGWVEITGTPGVDYTATTHSSSTGYDYRTGTVTLPIALDTGKPKMIVATDCSNGLAVLKANMNDSGDKLTVQAGLAMPSTVGLTNWATGIYVAGYKKV